MICHLSSDEAFRGYWRRPDADEKAFRDGWYYPGDLGRLDSDGDLWIVGRLDDMIITGGENVHPVEVENVVAAYDAVEEVAVVGAPDERCRAEQDNRPRWRGRSTSAAASLALTSG